MLLFRPRTRKRSQRLRQLEAEVVGDVRREPAPPEPRAERAAAEPRPQVRGSLSKLTTWD